MFYLPLSLKAWNSESFNTVINNEICSISSDLLPLQQGLSYSNFAIADKLSVSVLNTQSNEENLLIKAGLFYTGIISGCSCADDPTPVDENNEYCEVLFCVNRKTAATTASLIQDSFESC